MRFLVNSTTNLKNDTDCIMYINERKQKQKKKCKQARLLLTWLIEHKIKIWKCENVNKEGKKKKKKNVARVRREKKKI